MELVETLLRFVTFVLADQLADVGVVQAGVELLDPTVDVLAFQIAQ